MRSTGPASRDRRWRIGYAATGTSPSFERAPTSRTGGYVIDFWGLGFEIAERMGLVPALLARCYRMEPLSMVDADGTEVAGLDMRPVREMLNGRFITLARADLADALLSACQDVPTHFGVSIVGIGRDGQEAIVTLSDQRQECPAIRVEMS
ncbi:MAG: hypothetical protein ABIT71_08795 [Vicinamibacteraceae bacterium]